MPLFQPANMPFYQVNNPGYAFEGDDYAFLPDSRFIVIDHPGSGCL